MIFGRLRLLPIGLDAEACKGIGFCETVLPGHVFEADREERVRGGSSTASGNPAEIR